MSWLERFGDGRIRQRALRDPDLREVLEISLREIHRLLRESGRAFSLEATVTKTGENLIRMRVGYRSREERDCIWDRAAEIMEEARAGRAVDILCGIYRLPELT